MSEMTTAQEFLLWLTSAAGLGVAVPFIVSLVKKYVKVEGWQAMLLTLLIAIVLGGGAVLVLETGAYVYLEQYWGLIVAVITVVFGSSQAVYHLAPRTGRKIK